MQKETIREIGEAADRRHREELRLGVGNCAVARARCHVSGSGMSYDKEEVFWLTNLSPQSARPFTGGEGMPVYKNTKIGETLIRHRAGTQTYTQVMKGGVRGRVNEVTVEILNRAAYNPTRDTLQGIAVNDETGEVHYYEDLAQLLRAVDATQQQLDKEREQLAQEQERMAEEEVRLREERIRQYEERLRLLSEHKEAVRGFVRKGAALRSQHILDPSQEAAKRSHVFDGVPVVIEGGPGTGKTTTTIQRLKFLLSKEALQDYENGLTTAQIDRLTDPAQANTNWLFFSPTAQLLGYLRQNMQEEGLRANEANTTTLDKFDSRIMLDYKLRVPDKKGPFLLVTKLAAGEEHMITEPAKMVRWFNFFFVDEVRRKFVEACTLKTDTYSWHALAVEIKAMCKRAENIKNTGRLMSLINSLEDTYKKRVAEIEKALSDEVSKVADSVRQRVEADAEKKERLREMFQRWQDENFYAADDDETDDDETYDEEAESPAIDFDTELYRNLRPLVRKMSLVGIDDKLKWSKRQRELRDVVEPCFDGVSLERTGDLCWFAKNYAPLCKGLSTTLLNQFTRIYKAFRKRCIASGWKKVNLPLMKKYVEKGNKRLHPDELHMLVGFINRQLQGIYRRSRSRFEKLANNKYMQAWRSHAKYVIGVDEATDFSWLDYYFISSFRHWEFASLTLCGDAMQGLQADGVQEWDELTAGQVHVLDALDVFELTQSYRQTRALVDMARQMYADDRGREAPYDTVREDNGLDALPLAFVSDDEDAKAAWMARRIVDVFRKFGDTMPSVAVFVGDDEDVPAFIGRLREQDCLNSIEVADCTDNRTSQQTKCVRVFRMREVKGMEFEVAFFHNIDRALRHEQPEMMRRYLYVGISRASSHLAATFTQEDAGQSVLKYFNREATNWRV